MCVSLRTLCVVVDSLSCTDSSISAAAQRWLVRALSLNDVIRILEPILLLLLHPSTQRCSIQSIKQNVTAGEVICQQCVSHVINKIHFEFNELLCFGFKLGLICF